MNFWEGFVVGRIIRRLLNKWTILLVLAFLVLLLYLGSQPPAR